MIYGKSRKWLLEAMTSSKQTRTVHLPAVGEDSTSVESIIAVHHQNQHVFLYVDTTKLLSLKGAGRKRHSAKDIQLVVKKGFMMDPTRCCRHGTIHNSFH